jgi:ubiquinone/menaquinone biosynthesis C-methylase UbiE
MAKTKPFEVHSDRYEKWFVKNKFAYLSELTAIKMQLPKTGKGLEIGVGTGLFAEPLGIKIGIEPATSMGIIAQKRGIKVIEAVAEALPFGDVIFDFALMVTTICFLDDVTVALNEAYRVIKPDGQLILGFVEKNSPLGKIYMKFQKDSLFYNMATFYSVDEVVSLLLKGRFSNFSFSQTIFQDLKDIACVEGVKDGYGDGSFIVIKAIRN